MSVGVPTKLAQGFSWGRPLFWSSRVPYTLARRDHFAPFLWYKDVASVGVSISSQVPILCLL